MNNKTLLVVMIGVAMLTLVVGITVTSKAALIFAGIVSFIVMLVDAIVTKVHNNTGKGE